MCYCFHIQICSWKHFTFSKRIFVLWNVWICFLTCSLFLRTRKFYYFQIHTFFSFLFCG
ncbi:hypothetical protein AMTRI_Chr05g65500 [Amborella trichopoda]